MLAIKNSMSKKSNAKSGVGGILSNNINLNDSPIKLSKKGVITIRTK